MHRRHRTITALIGLLLLTAQAGAGVASAAAGSERALPKRDISSRVTDASNRLHFRGNVSPGWAHEPVIIQKKKCKQERCRWFGYTTVKSNGKGGFKARIGAPKKGYWYWRAKVKKDGGYGTSYSSAWRTFIR